MPAFCFVGKIQDYSIKLEDAVGRLL
jgi:hypothetical protein